MDDAAHGDDLILTDEEIAALGPAELAEYHDLLEDAALSPTAWRRRARPEQLPPDDDWRTLFLRGGRGSGKSWAGARILAELIADDPLRATEGAGQWAVVAPTFADVRDVCIESESGLLAALGTSRAEIEAGRSRRVATWNRSLGEVRLRDGSVVFCDGADDGALRIQGKNLRSCWADEIGLWKRWEQAWDESIAYALRKGTPAWSRPGHRRRRCRRVRWCGGCSTTRLWSSAGLRTFDNAEHLSDAFLDSVKRQAGTRLARQELEGELLEDVEGALWSASWFERLGFRVAGAPSGGWARAPVTGLDPSDGTAAGAQHAYTIVALGRDHKLYVIESVETRGTPHAFAKAAIEATARHGGRMVIEKNHGGAWLVEVVERVLMDLGKRVPYRVVHASQGKVVRAEPIASLYESGHVRHIGAHPELEESMATWTGAPGESSPDVLDSAVWAMSEFTGETFGPGSTEDGWVPWDDSTPSGTGWAESQNDSFWERWGIEEVVRISHSGAGGWR